uniref:Uncharacterized protein n=1 Tax=Physcomitrium patens TaxID=3218 RepID=A0A2K1LB28_PHYPA|nr:hypothetical protein PHYPA_001648 [Physcomitrium patens]
MRDAFKETLAILKDYSGGRQNLKLRPLGDCVYMAFTGYRDGLMFLEDVVHDWNSPKRDSARQCSSRNMYCAVRR